MRARARILVLAGLLLAPALAGCITFYGEGESEVRVLVTRDVGTEVLHEDTVAVDNGSTAMDALRAVVEVETSYGGGFVEAIDGLESQYPDSKVDWFYHVNSRLADVGAAQYEVEPGDVVLFDYRSWNRTMVLPHVLTGMGEWPIEDDAAADDRETFVDRQEDSSTRGQLYARVNGTQLSVLDADGVAERKLEAPWLLAHALAGEDTGPEMLLVASGEEGRALVDELRAEPPTGVGAVLTPSERLEVPAG